MPSVLSTESTTRQRIGAAVLGAVALLGLVLLLLDSVTLDALARMAGQNPNAKGKFVGIHGYLEAVQASLIPLAIPIAGIGLVGGAVAYLVGNQMAQKMLGGVFIGLILALFAPVIVA